MYAWSILAAVATYAAASTTDDSSTTTDTTYAGDLPAVQDATDDQNVISLMTSNASIVPKADAEVLSRTVTVKGAAATGEKFEDPAVNNTALAEPTTWTCVTAPTATDGKYECYGTKFVYKTSTVELTASLRLADTLPYTESPQPAVARRLAGTTNATPTECERVISIEGGVGKTEISKTSDPAKCDDIFTVAVADQSTTDTSAWTAVLVYKVTEADADTATANLKTLGDNMKEVKAFASVVKTPNADAFTSDATIELAAETPTPTPTPEPDEPDTPDDGGKDEDGAATLAAAAGAAISAAAFLF